VKEMNDIDRKIADVVETKKTALSRMDVHTLRGLSKYESEHFNIDNSTFELGIYHEKLDSGDDLVVVQCYRQTSKFLWMTAGNMHTKGFVLQADGTICDAEDKLLWDYK